MICAWPVVPPALVSHLPRCWTNLTWSKSGGSIRGRNWVRKSLISWSHPPCGRSHARIGYAGAAVDCQMWQGKWKKKKNAHLRARRSFGHHRSLSFSRANAKIDIFPVDRPCHLARLMSAEVTKLSVFCGSSRSPVSVDPSRFFFLSHRYIPQHLRIMPIYLSLDCYYIESKVNSPHSYCTNQRFLMRPIMKMSFCSNLKIYSSE